MLSYTYVLGGMLWGVINVFNIKYSFNGLLIYNFEFPVGLIFVLFAVLFWLFKNFIVELKDVLKTSQYLYNVKIVDNNVEVWGTGFFDSGNNVKFNDNGVVIISIDMFLKLHKEISIEKVLLKRFNDVELKNLNYITISSLSNDSKFLTFTVDEFYVENVLSRDVTVAVSIKNFENFDCVLHECLLGGEK
jgi:hypothetical protein